nr:hypothetical protein [uncultured Roseateles sp.]
MADSTHDQQVLSRVRSNPSFYLAPGRTNDLRDLSLELANDAVYLGADRVAIERFDGWHLVSASVDWITQEAKCSARESFFRLQVFHQYRQNATRAPVLIAAFCSDVAIFLEAEAEVVQGCSSGLQVLAAYVSLNHPSGRVVAIRGPYSANAGA